MIRKILKFFSGLVIICILALVIQSQYTMVSISETLVERQNELNEIQERNMLLVTQQIQILNDKMQQMELIDLDLLTKSRKPSFDYLKAVTVMIKCQSETSQRHIKWLGTGVVVKVTENFTYVLTNKHVAGVGRPKVEINIVTSTQTKQATVVKFHEYYDLALMRVEGKLEGKLPVKGISFSKPQEKVYLVGHHLGRKYLYGEGVFAGYDRLYSVVQIPCLFGSSGSGVFDKDGNLISLIFAVTVQPIGGVFPVVDVAHGIAIDGISIKIFLKEYLE